MVAQKEFKVNFKLAPLGLRILTGPDGKHVVSEIIGEDQASKNDVRTNDIVILVNDETINAAMSHDKLIELLFNQTKDFSMTFQRAGESRENVVVHFEKGAMGLMTEGKNGEIRVRNLIIGGQAHSKNVAIGDVVSGIGNTPLCDILQEPDNTEMLTNHLKKIMQEEDEAIVINFNGIANAKKVVAEQAHSAPPPAAKKSPAKEDELASFKKLMIQGLEVNKIHAKPGPFGAKSRAQILYMDADLKMILCGTNKGTDTKKKFPIKDVAQIKPVNKHAKQFTIITGGKTKGELTVEVPSENARNLIMQRLAQLIREQKKA